MQTAFKTVWLRTFRGKTVEKVGPVRVQSPHWAHLHEILLSSRTLQTILSIQVISSHGGVGSSSG
jgi:hypothetical protein